LSPLDQANSYNVAKINAPKADSYFKTNPRILSGSTNSKNSENNENYRRQLEARFKQFLATHKNSEDAQTVFQLLLNALNLN